MDPVPRRKQLETIVVRRLSPERTRRATMSERLTVRRFSWETLVRLNFILELSGKIATGVWSAFIAAVIFGVDSRSLIEKAFNSGRPLEGLLGVVILLPTLIFLALHSTIGYLRWRVQRELWRRDVDRLSAAVEATGGTAEAGR